MELIDRDLSEPYSIFTYRYFVAQWPKLCFLAVDPTGGRAAAAAAPKENDDDATTKPIRPPVLLPDGEGAAAGVVISKAEPHRDRGLVRGYLAMLVVDNSYRARGIGGSLARRAIRAMREHPCDELALEAEAGNHAALALYRNLGFARDKRLHRYYLNGADAYRLKLLLPRGREALERQREEKALLRGQQGMVVGDGEGLEGEEEEGDGDGEEEAARALAGLQVAAA
jgi:peptide alpha-N-acetyltransferase